MLNFSQVTLRRGVRALFTDATFIIHAGNKVGVTGANGTGKSSLFAMLRGELHIDEGDFSMPPKLEIAHVAQETPALQRAAIDYVIDGDRALRAAEAQLEQAEASGDGHALADAHTLIESLDGYTAESRAARLLDGLGFTQAQQRTNVADFSGGWRMRLNLAQALMCRSDLLLLDEPTNHLDLDAVIWLEDWLRSYPGTLLLISHDRDFLDRVVGHIAHIEQGGVTLYTGNYSAFERQRAAQLAQQQAAFEKQQREKAHMHSFVERFRAKATKARQAQSRLKALARMEEIAPAHVDSPFHFEFRAPDAVPSPMLSLENASFGYADKRVLNGANFTLMPGDRIGLLGANGAGKSTLIKALAGELAAQSGSLAPAKTLRIGYFAQHQLEQLDPAASPLLHLQRLDKRATEKDLRNYLGGFGFNGDQALAVTAPFSGGEKARLVLALLVYQKPNLLLLDEPTNHLDLEMRHALTMALQGFEGAMVVVSHDRHILRSVADSLWLVAGGKVQPFDDDLDGYARWLAEQRNQRAADEQFALGGSADTGADNSAEAKKARKRAEADRRKALQPLKRVVERAEQKVEKLTAALAKIEEKLGDAGIYADERKSDLKAALAERADLRGQLDDAEAEWMDASEALEAAEK
jgi:ATP-binding cassette subfamily F protein 3